jgi:hypothetical protein
MNVAPKQSPFIVNITGPGADAPGFRQELAAAFSADVQPSPIMGGAADVWRYAVEWGPHILAFAVAVKPVLEVTKLATEIVDKLLHLLKRHPGMKLIIPSRDGPIEVDGASREMVVEMLKAELARGAASEKTP